MELIQEFPNQGMDWTIGAGPGTMIFFPAVPKNCPVEKNVKRRDFFDYALTGLQWARPLPDGR